MRSTVLAVVLLLAVAVRAAAPSRKPAAKQISTPKHGTALGVRQQDEEVDPAVIKEVFTSPVPGSVTTASPSERQDSMEGQEPFSPEFICSVFGGPSCPDNQPINVPCLCDSSEACECLPYYQCDKKTGAVNEFGVGVIDIRNQGNSTCPHYIYKCCKTAFPAKPPRAEPPSQPQNPEPSYPNPSDPDPSNPSNPDPSNPDPSNPDSSNPDSSNPDSSNPDSSNPSNPDVPSNPYPDTVPEPPRPDDSNNQQPDPPKPSNPIPEFPDTDQRPSRPIPMQPGPNRCGQRNPEGIGVRITGDENGESQFGEFPWMVAVLRTEVGEGDKRRNLYQCGGALITPQIVLTAAHCVVSYKAYPGQLGIRAGEWDTQTNKEMYRHQDVLVVDIEIHPDYYGGAVHNDVALLFLTDPVIVGYHIGTICMPEQDQNFDHQTCFVSGWGKDKFGQAGRYQVILKKLELPIVPHEECQQALRTTRLGQYFKLHDSFMCAGGEAGRDTCNGDGGSPLVCPLPSDPSRYTLAGTVAWGIDCGLPGVPGVYAKVSLYRNWVDNVLSSHRINATAYIP